MRYNEFIFTWNSLESRLNFCAERIWKHFPDREYLNWILKIECALDEEKGEISVCQGQGEGSS